MEKNLLILKPETLELGIHWEVLRFLEEQKQLKIIFLKSIITTAKQVEQHCFRTDEALIKWGEEMIELCVAKADNPTTIFGYEKPIEIGREIQRRVVTYLSNNPIMIVIIDGLRALSGGADWLGHMFPEKATAGTLRRRFTTLPNSFDYHRKGVAVQNTAHAPKTTADLYREAKIWLTEAEIAQWLPDL